MSSHVEFPVQLPQPSPVDNLKEPKRYRVYFNSRAAFPHIWSVDEGTSDSEIIVQHCYFQGCDVIAGTNLGPQPPNARDDKAVAWMEVYAVAVFVNGGVTFYGRN